uniref:Uncharacterized protein n=1 Tax=Anguilla anguilla TaxID=7936 RepID=A0A0E9PL84_ANGAN
MIKHRATKKENLSSCVRF